MYCCFSVLSFFLRLIRCACLFAPPDRRHCSKAKSRWERGKEVEEREDTIA